ncbi:hypothetical protein HJG60_007902 [Phyllostomus discolor]|uniref:Uncharacterized protein n=1 Tax=Phyllostomus discolor TaxID=89673 RepID=A0A834BDC2_9CHIR|nr:hypothetical protein HJG60_007902 [Phyllostomus discolor]
MGTQACITSILGLPSESLVLVGTALPKHPLSCFDNFLDDPWLPLRSLQTLPNTPLGVSGPFRFRQFTFPRPSVLAFAFLSPATWLGYASTPLPTPFFRFMNNPNECKVGMSHDSGSSPYLGGGGSGSSDFVVPGAKVQSPSCPSASPAFTSLEVHRAVSSLESPRRGARRALSFGPHCPGEGEGVVSPLGDDSWPLDY